VARPAVANSCQQRLLLLLLLALLSWMLLPASCTAVAAVCSKLAV
jgi:hypothetical protein